MGKTPSLPNFFRSGDEWHVGTKREKKDDFVAVKAQVVGDDPTPLTSTDWKYRRAHNFESDSTLICALPEDYSPCSVRLTLRGLAKKIQGKCQGLYKECKGLSSMGRKVNVVNYLQFDRVNV